MDWIPPIITIAARTVMTTAVRNGGMLKEDFSVPAMALDCTEQPMPSVATAARNAKHLPSQGF